MSHVTSNHCVYRILRVSTDLSVGAKIFCTIHFGLVVTLAGTIWFVSYVAKVWAQPSPPTSVRMPPIRSKGHRQHHLPALCAIIATSNWLPVWNKTVCTEVWIMPSVLRLKVHKFSHINLPYLEYHRQRSLQLRTAGQHTAVGSRGYPTHIWHVFVWLFYCYKKFFPREHIFLIFFS